MNNQEELSMNAEGSIDKLNINYQLMVIVQCKSAQTVAAALAAVTSTLEAKYE